MSISREQSMKFLGELIENHSTDPVWNEIIDLMNKSSINFSPYMIYGEDFDSTNTVSLLDLDRDLNLSFADKEELLYFIKCEDFILYVEMYRLFYKDIKEKYPNRHIDDFNFFVYDDNIDKEPYLQQIRENKISRILK